MCHRAAHGLTFAYGDAQSQRTKIEKWSRSCNARRAERVVAFDPELQAVAPQRLSFEPFAETCDYRLGFGDGGLNTGQLQRRGMRLGVIPDFGDPDGVLVAGVNRHDKLRQPGMDSVEANNAPTSSFRHPGFVSIFPIRPYMMAIAPKGLDQQPI
jgi:hypothetical protein